MIAERDAVAVVTAAAHGDTVTANILVAIHDDPIAVACGLAEIAAAALGALADEMAVPLEELLATCGRWAVALGAGS